MAIILRPLPEDQAVNELRRLVQLAIADVRLKIRSQLLGAKPVAQLRRLETELQGILTHLNRNMQFWTETQVPAAWQRGYTQAVTALERTGLLATQRAGFTGVNVPAANLLAENLVRRLEVGTLQQLLEATGTAQRFIGRRVFDMYRQLGLDAGAQRILTGKAYTAVAQDMVAKLEAEGVLWFTDAGGRKWSLESYAQMVSRTVLRETETVALTTGLQDNGYDLVYVPWHKPTCPVCARLQDRVYSISGRTEGYPQLPRWPPHPNCRHPLVPYFPAQDSNADATREQSNREAEADPRSEAERTAYAVTQERNRLIRQERQLAQLKAGGSVPLGKRGEELRRLAEAGDPEARANLLQLQRRLRDRLTDRLAETRRRLRALPVVPRATGGLSRPS